MAPEWDVLKVLQVMFFISSGWTAWALLGSRKTRGQKIA
jgi:hypothetical protein